MKSTNESVEKIVSTISLSYRDQWSLWDSYREIVANTLDATNRLPYLEVNERVAVVYDKGEGMTKAQFVILGEGVEKGENKIGRFKEGIKIGLGRLIKEGTKVTAESRDWKCTIGVEESLGVPVLVYYFEQVESPITGVKYTLENIDTKKIMEYHNTRFLPTESNDYIVNNSDYGKMMSGRFAGKLYNKRVYVCDTHKKSEYGYDLHNMVLGTDRQYSNPRSVGVEIANVLYLLHNAKHINKVLDALQKDTLESEIISAAFNSSWYEVFINKYGENAVVSYSSDLRGKVSYHGGKLVKFQTIEIVYALKRLGIPEAIQYIRERAEKRRARKHKTFDGIAQKKKRNVLIAFGLVKKINMFENDFKSLVENDNLYFYSSIDGTSGYQRGDTIYIAFNELNDPVSLAETIIHEMIHLEKRTTDLSAEHQQYQDEAIKKLLKVVYKYLSPKVLIDSVK